MNVRTIQLEDVAQFEQIAMVANSKKLNLHQWLDMRRTRLLHNAREREL
jgi:hypothetical protein